MKWCDQNNNYCEDCPHNCKEAEIGNWKDLFYSGITHQWVVSYMKEGTQHKQSFPNKWKAQEYYDKL